MDIVKWAVVGVLFYASVVSIDVIAYRVKEKDINYGQAEARKYFTIIKKIKNNLDRQIKNK